MIRVSKYATIKGNHECWVLRYRDGGKVRSKTIGKTRDVTKTQAEAARRDLEAAFIKGTKSPGRPDKVTLRRFIDDYPARRRQDGDSKGYLRTAPRLSEASITSHQMSLRYLVEHFGDGRDMNTITLADASTFIDRLAAGQLQAARRTSQQYDLSPQTVRLHIRNLKAIYGWAITFELVKSNPFAKFDGSSRPGDEKHYITLGEFRQMYGAVPRLGWPTAKVDGWQLFLALLRLAGLRREAARTLPWSGYATDSDGKRHWIGVDWDRHRICVVGNCKGSRRSLRYREVPVRPLLFRILRKAYESSPARFQHPQSCRSDSICGVAPHNLTRLGKSIVAKAGLKPWPKLYQAMRSSCENDHKMRGVAEATYSAWLGHSPTVSRRHYTSPTDSEFAAAARVA